MSDFLFGREHVERYQATDGAEGYDWLKGTTILLLTTTGRRTGEQRTTPLIFREVDGAYVIVASKGGADEPPAWYVNLEAQPDVEVQIKGDRFPARARTASSEERARIWPLMAEVWPDYDAYQAKTDREIPIVLLERS
jgi:deazaflavin-dependent oxidoreductase (nitroreductase family)